MCHVYQVDIMAMMSTGHTIKGVDLGVNTLTPLEYPVDIPWDGVDRIHYELRFFSF